MTFSEYAPEELHYTVQTGPPPPLIDVRTPAEFQAAHIEGAVNLPLNVLQQDPSAVARTLPLGTVLVCQSGVRARQAAQCLVEAGCRDLQVLDGGVIRFEKIGGTLLKGRQRWAMDRQVRMTAGLLVLGGFLGSRFSPQVGYLCGAIGAGLAVSAATDSCAMARVLNKMPWNKTEADPTLVSAFEAIPRATHVL